jgi:hypothetical protein
MAPPPPRHLNAAIARSDSLSKRHREPPCGAATTTSGEYLLLGILAEDSDTTTRLNDLGVTKAFVQQKLAVQFAKIQAERTQRAPEPES